MFLPLQGGGYKGEGDLPEQYNYVFSIMASLVSILYQSLYGVQSLHRGVGCLQTTRMDVGSGKNGLLSFVIPNPSLFSV
jgi:hypothetical protein